MIEKIQNRESAWLPVLFGLVVIVIYKFWKIFCVKFLISDTGNVYLQGQILFTIFRALATIAGVFLLRKFYFNYKVEMSIDRFTLLNLFVLLPLYFLIRFCLFHFSFNMKAFAVDLPFNFLTGSFEEIFFRGLIFVGLAHYMKTFFAILLSAVLFSLWHYDVISYWPEYIIIFCWGFYAAVCFSYGASLFSLTLFHFLWDQIFFGINWEFISEQGAAKAVERSAIAQILLLILAIAYVFIKQNKTKKRPE